MRDFFQEIPKVFRAGLAALACALLPASALAAPPAQANAQLNQRDLQVLSHQVNNHGSDESLRNSAVYAMQALMDVNASKLPSAMTNGYRAYGKFRNSENLDRMKDLNALNANSLASIGAEGATLPTKTVTSFRRLDPSFLHQGEAGKVAAEFERQTGMKRNDFLVHMADVSEKKISRADPQMIDKAFSRLEGFIDKIPNQEFRKNLEKNLHIVPEGIRRGIVAQAVSKLAGFFADAGGASALPASMEASMLAAKPGEGQDAASLAAAGQDAPKDDRRPAATVDPASGAANAALDKKPSSGKSALLSSVVASAIKTQVQDAKNEEEPREQTIFQQIHQRYRVLTPDLLGLPK